MPDTIVIECPQCKKQLKAPAELKGKKIRCKGCGTTFAVQEKSELAATVEVKPDAKQDAKQDAAPFGFAKEDEVPKPAPAEKKPAPKKPTVDKKPAKKVDDDDEENSNPYGVTEEKLIARCPHCAKEMESEEAVICLHCGYNTRTRVHGQLKRVHDITSQDRIQWLMPGIVCVVSIVVLIGIDAFVLFGMTGVWKSLEENTVESASGIRWWFVAFTAWIIWKCGCFAFQRLVLNPTPPEEEIRK